MKTICTLIIITLSFQVFACKTTAINGSKRFIKGAIEKIDINKFRSYSLKNVEKNTGFIIIELTGPENDCVEQKYTVVGLPNCDVEATLVSSTSCRK